MKIGDRVRITKTSLAGLTGTIDSKYLMGMWFIKFDEPIKWGLDFEENNMAEVLAFKENYLELLETEDLAIFQ